MRMAARLALGRGARRAVAAAIVVAFAAGNLLTQRGYTVGSRNAGRDATVMFARLGVLDRVPPDTPVLLDVGLPGYAGIIALSARGHPTFELGVTGGSAASRTAREIRALPGRSFFARPLGLPDLAPLARIGTDGLQAQEFPLGPGDAPVHRFLQYVLPPSVDFGAALMVAAAGDQTRLNVGVDRPQSGRFYLRPLAATRNHLTRVDSNLARMIQPGIIDDIALWQREPDWANPDGGLQGAGRHLLFEILNPVPNSRLLLDFTTGPLAGFGLPLPQAVAVGADRVALDMVGRGAARVITAPIAPRIIGGRAYIAVDMGAEPRRFGANRRGVLGLYNRTLGFDPRAIVGFVRNLSLVSPEQLAALAAPPAAVDRFPAGLFAPGLLYSGFYEDGWVGEVVRLRLALPGESRRLRVSGLMPGFREQLRSIGIEIVVDGESVLRRRLDPGDFTLAPEIQPAAGPRMVELRFDAADRLSPSDPRIASVLLRSIALEGAP